MDGVKPSTLAIYRYVCKLLIQHFGYDRSIATISTDNAKSFISDLSQRLCKTSISSASRRYRSLFRYGVKQGFLNSSPFDFTIERVDSDESRWHYITPDTIHKVLNSCRSDHERLPWHSVASGACAVRPNSTYYISAISTAASFAFPTTQKPAFGKFPYSRKSGRHSNIFPATLTTSSFPIVQTIRFSEKFIFWHAGSCRPVGGE